MIYKIKFQKFFQKGFTFNKVLQTLSFENSTRVLSDSGKLLSRDGSYMRVVSFSAVVQDLPTGLSCRALVYGCKHHGARQKARSGIAVRVCVTSNVMVMGK